MALVNRVNVNIPKVQPVWLRCFSLSNYVCGDRKILDMVSEQQQKQHNGENKKR